MLTTQSKIRLFLIPFLMIFWVFYYPSYAANLSIQRSQGEDKLIVPAIRAEPTILYENRTEDILAKFNTDLNMAITEITHPGATSISVIFSELNLPKDVRMEISNPDRTELHVYGENDFNRHKKHTQDNTFMTTPINGDHLIIRVVYPKGNTLGYNDKLILDAYSYERAATEDTRVIFGTDQRKPTACYKQSTDPELNAMYWRSLPVARITVKKGDTREAGTAWFFGDTSLMVTNHHALGLSQYIPGTKVELNYESPDCNPPLTPHNTVAVEVEELIVTGSDGNFDDFSLFTINSFDLVHAHLKYLFGGLKIVTTPPSPNYLLYVPQHGDGLPKKISHLLSINEVIKNCTVNRISGNNSYGFTLLHDCNVSGGSSGAPIILRHSHEVAAINVGSVGQATPMNAGTELSYLWENEFKKTIKNRPNENVDRANTEVLGVGNVITDEAALSDLKSERVLIKHLFDNQSVFAKFRNDNASDIVHTTPTYSTMKVQALILLGGKGYMPITVRLSRICSSQEFNLNTACPIRSNIKVAVSLADNPELNNLKTISLRTWLPIEVSTNNAQRNLLVQVFYNKGIDDKITISNGFNSMAIVSDAAVITASADRARTNLPSCQYCGLISIKTPYSSDVYDVYSDNEKIINNPRYINKDNTYVLDVVGNPGRAKITIKYKGTSLQVRTFIVEAIRTQVTLKHKSTFMGAFKHVLDVYLGHPVDLQPIIQYSNLKSEPDYGKYIFASSNQNIIRDPMFSEFNGVYPMQVVGEGTATVTIKNKNNGMMFDQFTVNAYKPLPIIGCGQSKGCQQDLLGNINLPATSGSSLTVNIDDSSNLEISSDNPKIISAVLSSSGLRFTSPVGVKGCATITLKYKKTDLTQEFKICTYSPLSKLQWINKPGGNQSLLNIDSISVPRDYINTTNVHYVDLDVGDISNLDIYSNNDSVIKPGNYSNNLLNLLPQGIGSATITIKYKDSGIVVKTLKVLVHTPLNKLNWVNKPGGNQDLLNFNSISVPRNYINTTNVPYVDLDVGDNSNLDIYSSNEGIIKPGKHSSHLLNLLPQDVGNATIRIKDVISGAVVKTLQVKVSSPLNKLEWVKKPGGDQDLLDINSISVPRNYTSTHELKIIDFDVGDNANIDIYSSNNNIIKPGKYGSNLLNLSPQGLGNATISITYGKPSIVVKKLEVAVFSPLSKLEWVAKPGGNQDLLNVTSISVPRNYASIHRIRFIDFDVGDNSNFVIYSSNEDIIKPGKYGTSLLNLLPQGVGSATITIKDKNTDVVVKTLQVKVIGSVPATFNVSDMLIKNSYSGLTADMPGGSVPGGIKKGIQLKQYFVRRTAAQSFNIIPTGSLGTDNMPRFKIIPTFGDPSLALDNRYLEDLIFIQNYVTGTGAHEWYIYDNGDKTYTFINASAEDKKLDLETCSKNADVKLKLQARPPQGCSEASSKWIIESS